MSEEIDLEERFPDMTPINGTPSLFTVNGCGLMLYGARDHDVETGTYVKTHCITLIFIPLFAIRSYRVVDAENGGWYFIGREPISAFARIWNVVVIFSLLASLAVGAWVSHNSNPNRIAERKLEEANELAGHDKWMPAAKKYEEVINTRTPSSPKAETRLGVLYSDAAQRATINELVELMQLAQNLWDRGIRIDDLAKLGVQIVERFAVSDPSQAYVILGVVDKLMFDTAEADQPDAKQLSSTRKKVLQGVVAAKPDDLPAVGELAALLAAEGKLGECRKLLEPHAASLRDTEGARILGQIYAREGKIDQAHALLSPYCNKHLGELHSAEKRLTDAYQSLNSRIVAELNAGRGHQEFRDETRNLSQAERQKAYSGYLMKQMKTDPAVNRARRDIQRSSGVVRVAIDLGIVQLQRSRGLADPAARQAELKRAEETFLAIRGVAGEDDRYRLNLGQVYYWLGRQAEGQKQFDDLLASQNRNPRMLVTVAETLRTLGAESEAKKLVEEAYNRGTDNRVKFSAAMIRAMLERDLQQRIVWLKRTDPAEKGAQADLSTAMGRVAQRDRRDGDAEKHFRKSVALYDQLPETASSLNNSALVLNALYQLTNSRADFDEATRRMEKAISLEPTNAILIRNAGDFLVQGAIQSLIQDQIDLKIVPIPAGVDLFSYLYDKQAERAGWEGRVRQHTGFQKGLKYLNNAALLAPKSADNYSALLSLDSFLHDHDAMRELRTRIEAANVDSAQSASVGLDFIQGKNLDKRRIEFQSHIAKLRKAIDKSKSKQDLNFAVVRASLSSSLVMYWMAGGATTASEVVRLAEAAHQAAPSAGTRGALSAAYSFRALQLLSPTNPRLKSISAEYRRVLAPRQIVAAVLARDEPAGKALAQHPDIVKLLSLEREAIRDFPDDVDVIQWALLHQTEPDVAKSLAERIRKNEHRRLKHEISALLNPINPGTSLSRYWLRTLEGKNAEADKILQGLKKHAIELPVGK